MKIDRQIWPIVVAHRGASAHHPENTLESFRAAVEAGADVIELDVRLTSDGKAVVLHDADVSATTDGSGLVHTLSLAEVKRLDASGGQGPRTEVPTLAEALHVLSGRAGVDIEIKNMPGEPAFDSPREDVAREVVRVLAEHPFQGEVLISSFNWLSIEWIRDLDPDVATGFLTGFLTPAAVDPRASLVYARARGHDYVLPHVMALLEAGSDFLDQAHAEGVRVGTWTVDEPEAIERLFAMGVDAVASNDPATAVAIRDRFRDGG